MRLIEDHPERVGYLLKERVFAAAVLVDALRRSATARRWSTRRSSRDWSAGAPRRSTDRLTDESARSCRWSPRACRTGRSRRACSSPTRTVEAHVTQIFAKLDLDPGPDSHRRVLAVLALLRS